MGSSSAKGPETKWDLSPAVDAIYGDVHYRERGVEQEGPILSWQFAPRPRYQVSMETPDDASEEDAQNPEFMPLPWGMGTQLQPPCYGDVDHHGERHLRRCVILGLFDTLAFFFRKADLKK